MTVMSHRKPASPEPGRIIQQRVLIVEDEPAVATALQSALDRAAMVTAWADTGARATDLALSFLPHIVLIDLELPDMNGIELIGWMREHHDCGLIVVTGNEEEAERIIGLEIGADDYINKPPATRELVARVRALFRRVAGRIGEQPGDGARDTRRMAQGVLLIGNVTIDLYQRRATTSSGQDIDITAAEYSVLSALVDAGGEPVSRDTLSRLALRRPWRAEDRSIDQLVFLLRSKIMPGEKKHHFIQTVRGAGYRLVLPN